LLQNLDPPARGDDTMEAGQTMDTTRRDARAVTQQLVVALRAVDGSIIPVEARLAYDPTDPFAVMVVFHPDDLPVTWNFARCLLTDGLVEPTGDGDVHVWPCLDDEGRSIVTVELCSPHGDALVEMPADAVLSFADRMQAVVPDGEESAHQDVDALIAAIWASQIG
jgi:hypothetical protein